MSCAPGPGVALARRRIPGPRARPILWRTNQSEVSALSRKELSPARPEPVSRAGVAPRGVAPARPVCLSLPSAPEGLPEVPLLRNGNQQRTKKRGLACGASRGVVLHRTARAWQTDRRQGQALRALRGLDGFGRWRLIGRPGVAL